MQILYISKTGRSDRDIEDKWSWDEKILASLFIVKFFFKKRPAMVVELAIFHYKKCISC